MIIRFVSFCFSALALLGCSSERGVADVQGAFTWNELVGTAIPSSPIESFQARDGSTLFYRSYGEQSPIDLVLMHGSGFDSAYLGSLATRISSTGIARVWTPDVRGHGLSPQRRGDIDYVDQLEDDLADLSGWIRWRNPHGVLVIGGHSSGGGLAIRFAGGPYRGTADGYLLLAPFLQYDAPTVRPGVGGWATPKTSRIVGLNVLNAIGIRSFNGLTAIEFNLPPTYRTGNETLFYSYRLMTGFSPRNYVSDLRTLREPILVVAGADDEAFYAEEFRDVFGSLTPHADIELVADTTHLGLVVATELPPLVIEWLERSISSATDRKRWSRRADSNR